MMALLDTEHHGHNAFKSSLDGASMELQARRAVKRDVTENSVQTHLGAVDILLQNLKGTLIAGVVRI